MEKIFEILYAFIVSWPARIIENKKACVSNCYPLHVMLHTTPLHKTRFLQFIYLPGHEFSFEEPWNLDKKCCSNSWHDVIPGPIPLCIQIMVIVRETHSKEPFYGYRYHHVNRGNKCDTVKWVMKPRKDVHQVVMIEIFPRCSNSIHDAKYDMKAVACNQTYKYKNMCLRVRMQLQQLLFFVMPHSLIKY